MTDEIRNRLQHALDHAARNGSVLESHVAVLKSDVRALLAAGASEGQAVCVDCGDTIMAHDPGTCGNCHSMKYVPASAEIAALRERIAGMEKDAERYRYLRNCGVIVDFSHGGPWKFTDDVDKAVDRWMETRTPYIKEPE